MHTLNRITAHAITFELNISMCRLLAFFKNAKWTFIISPNVLGILVTVHVESNTENNPHSDSYTCTYIYERVKCSVYNHSYLLF